MNIFRKEKDLSLFEDHLNGDDESLKKTAKIFSKEFIQCRKDIEDQLNQLL